MSAGVAPRVRLLCLWAGILVVLLPLVPPLSGQSHHYEFTQVLRYALWALVAPPLLALGAPWRTARWASALAAGRRRHRELIRAAAFVVLGCAVMVWWFTPAMVTATMRHSWLSVVEVATLTIGGVALWLELIASPPLAPRSGHLRRVVLGACAMWLVWVEAYLVAMSQVAWYPSFVHVSGHGLSQAADQQVAAIVLWFIASIVFMPVIFANAMSWLRSEGDPDDELRRIVREQRRGASAIIDQRAARHRTDGAL